MEPLSIATGCIGLLSGVSKLSIQISAFVSSVRDARKDMAAVIGELSSLSLCLETLRDDSMKLEYPDGFQENLLKVLKNCDVVTTEMTLLLDKLSSANLVRKVQWTAMGRDDMSKLRSSLESHKSALEIGLDMTSLLLISAVKEGVADVKADTAQIPSIKQDTSQIEGLVQQIGLLRLQLDSGPVNDAKARHLQVFLDQSTSYAETVVDSIEDQEYHMQPSEGLVSELSDDNRDIASPNVNAISFNHDIPIKAGSQLSTTTNASDQSGTFRNTIEEKESCRQSSGNSLSGRFSDNREIPIADAEAAGAYRDSATRASGQLLATKDIPDEITATTSASSLSATAEAEKKLQQGAPAKPRTRQPYLRFEKLLMPTRDKSKIQEANALRQKMAVHEQKKLNVALELAIRGKKSLTARLRPKTAWWGKDTGSYDEIKDLLDRGADPNYRSFGLSLCDVEMSHAERVQVLNLLLMRGAFFTLSSSDRWLGMAARYGWSTLVENFLDSGSTPFAQDEALMKAASAGHNDIVMMLLEHGKSSVTQIGKDTAARSASFGHQFESVKLLLEHDASPDNYVFSAAASAGREDILKMSLDRGISANFHYGVVRAFDTAVQNGHLKAVNLLLEHGAVAKTAIILKPRHPGSSRMQAERNEMIALLKRYRDQQKRSWDAQLP